MYDNTAPIPTVEIDVVTLSELTEAASVWVGELNEYVIPGALPEDVPGYAAAEMKYRHAVRDAQALLAGDLPREATD